jgi:acyl-CoA reductase-like NAD-dependent aldehyde dehydrogenase
MIEPVVDWLRRMRDPLRNPAQIRRFIARLPANDVLEVQRASLELLANFADGGGDVTATQLEALLALDARLEPVIADLTRQYTANYQKSSTVESRLWHSVFDLVKAFIAAYQMALKAGYPRERDTFLGPLIDEASAERLSTWIAEAERAGAKRLCGGRRERNRLEATVLEDVPRDAKINRLEAFGPVTLLSAFDDFDDALARVNDSDYGLQAGVFTDSLAHATRAWDRLEVGGVVVNDVPSFRVDNMPYGGVKRSGLGREGIRYAIEDMTERRLMVLRG